MKIQHKVLSVFLAFLFLTTLVFAGGCVHRIQERTTPGFDTVAPSESTDRFESANRSAPTMGLKSQTATAKIVPKDTDSVLEVAPYTTPDPYPVMHATQFNETQEFSHLGSGDYQFTKLYILRGNATGLLIHVTKPPLYLIYTVSPDYDCTEDPDSCRGTLTKPVNRPYLTITVRDNATETIVAEDGYGREYSSDIGTYEFTISGWNDNGLLSSGESSPTEGTNTVYPGPRFIKIYRAGTYHVTLEGNFLSVTMNVRTGSASTTEKTGDTTTDTAGGAGDSEWG